MVRNLKKKKSESDEMFVIRNLLERHSADVQMLRRNDDSGQKALLSLAKEVKSLKQELSLLKSFVHKKMRE